LCVLKEKKNGSFYVVYLLSLQHSLPSYYEDQRPRAEASLLCYWEV